MLHWSDLAENRWIILMMLILVILTSFGIKITYNEYKKYTKINKVLNVALIIYNLSAITLWIMGRLMSLPIDEILLWYGWGLLGLILSVCYLFFQNRLILFFDTLDPSQLFIFSFVLLVLIGSVLLMMPLATHEGISFIDALFTATSAVCVTGLVVLDTSKDFTLTGQLLIMLLIEAGGLGIITFASYFGHFFKRGSSYKHQLQIKELTSSEKVSEVFALLKTIVGTTLFVQFIGAIFIFFSVSDVHFPSLLNKLFFCVFHAISAFCNAGFSTLSSGLYEPVLRYNYSFQLIIGFIIIMGGLGFPIVFNIIRYFKGLVIKRVLFLNKSDLLINKKRVINLSTKIILITTIILLTIGTKAFFVLEYNNTLAEHRTIFGKLVVSFFGSITPRTAGFNHIDMGMLQFPTIMVMILLMWIGTSPASTGGGIKTSTFAIATLNVISLARGKRKLELFKREIADITIRRAFAIIALSMITIGTSVFLISIFDSDKSLVGILFECVSAYSTVGLSLNLTPEFSDPSRLVLIVTMFLGRVGMINFVAAILKNDKHLGYKYPSEEILIN